MYLLLLRRECSSVLEKGRKPLDCEAVTRAYVRSAGKASYRINFCIRKALPNLKCSKTVAVKTIANLRLKMYLSKISSTIQ